jgi:hypothetical protein
VRNQTRGAADATVTAFVSSLGVAIDVDALYADAGA